MPTTDPFKGKVAIVTGAAQGLGLDYAMALAERGAHVVISDLGTDRAGEGQDPSAARTALQTMQALGYSVVAHTGQLENEDGCRQLVELAVEQFGALDILIHNAGWVDYQGIESQEQAFLDRALGISVHAPVWLAKHAWKYLKQSAAARIVLTTSDRAMYQRYAQPGLVAYSAGKMAQVGIMNALSMEGLEHGILVNAISPVAKTRMWGVTQPPEELKPEWVTPGVLYLASALCRDTGYILRASNGQFTATRFSENSGVSYPRDLARVEASSLAEVAERWSRIKECSYVPVKVANTRTDLGESPVWEARSGALYFVDITGGRIHRLLPDGEVERVYESAARIGALALTDHGNLIFTEDASVAILDVGPGKVRQYSMPVHHRSSFRFNDGACDPQGRFVTGLMDEGPSGKTGGLFRFDAELHDEVIHDGLALPNGLTWSADGKTVFFVDSVERAIYRAEYLEEGRLEEATLFAATPAELGRPDGIALDREGGLWVCQFNGSCLLRYDRDGHLTDQVVMPVPRPTSCCFGGANLDTLYITTARVGMSPTELRHFPDAGDLYSIRPEVGGIARHTFTE
ncbi:SDR family NAD(P)-dependent oxidoreductase [Pantoea sp. Ap-967]|uniref:SDR family NAD(P)-dependent oxidoreductase n=1 Tax=Pantoea sp. Ap-967 TaxID=2608362 RepID=UPI00142369E2|nr:SDR family NAD(P)-dependent oxidoreductase [Pantoea sp. Ap-967]NIE74859.1 SDR family NAD(P)-dependent oxidoreductase [Pantoea sp. Ap-967]